MTLEAMEGIQNILAVEKKRVAKKLKAKAVQDIKEIRAEKNARIEEELKQLRAEKNAKMSEIRTDRDEKLKKLRAEKNAKISEIRTEKNARIEEEYKKGIQKRKDVIEAHKTSDYISKIKKLQKNMVKMVQHPTDNVYVPKHMADTFNEACVLITDAINLDNGTKASEALLKLSDTIKKLNTGETSNGDYESAFDSEFIEQIDTLRELLGEKKIQRKNNKNNGLTLDEATAIHTVLHDIYYTVRDATKQIGREDAATNRASGEKIRDDMIELVENYVKNEILTKIKKEFLNGFRTARYYSGYNDNAEIMYHVNALNNGVRKQNNYKMHSEKMFSELTENKKDEYNSSLHNVHEIKFTDYNGNNRSVELTRMQGLQILMSWEREQSNENIVHMQKGGVVIPNPELLSKGKIEQAFDKAVTIHFINPSFINAVSNIMTDFEWEYKKIAEAYFNDVSKSAVNEISNVLKHRDVATEEYYIPFTVNQNYIIKELENLKYDSTLEGMGMLKAIMKKADQPIMISGLNLVVQRHINDTAKLYGLAIPIRNFKKALNVKLFETANDGTAISVGTVRESIHEKWGKDGTQFFDHLISDLETTREKPYTNASQMIDNAVKGLRNAMVVKTLVANISVVIKQAASYQTAGLYLSNRSLGKALRQIPYLLSNWNNVCNEIDSHTAQHYMRRIGLSTQEIANMQNSWFNNHVPTALNPAKWIQGVDCLTTALHWFAVKEQVNTQYRRSGKQIETEEYWNEVTNLYDKVIEDTQPMYDSLHRAEVQKVDNELWKFAFMFKTQPLQNAGIVYDTIGYALANKNNVEAKKAVGRAVSSQILSLATFAVMSFLAAMILHKPKRYKDENDEVTLTSVMSTVLTDMFVNGVGLVLPIFGTEITDSVTSVIKGNSMFDTFSVPVVDMLNDTFYSIEDTYNAIITSVNKISLGYDVNPWDIFSALGNMGIQISGFWGIPTQNMLNIFNGLKNHITDIAVGKSTFFESDGNRKPKEYAESYGNFYTKGDKEKAVKQLDILYQYKYDEQISKGENSAKAAKSARTSVRMALQNAYKFEYQKAFLRNDRAKMQEIANLLQASGYMKWDDKTLSQALNDWAKNAREDVDTD